MSSSLHLKIENSEAVQSKKEFLLLQKNILESQEHIRNFGDLKKKEFMVRNKLRILFSQIGKEINTIENTFPEIESKEEKEVRHIELGEELTQEKPKVKKAKQDHKRKEISREIDDIRAKLAALG